MPSARWLAILLLLTAVSAPAVHADGASRTAWTAAGAGGGFGVGVWAGLSAFDDAIHSDRKVWASAIVGAGAGAVAGYLIGRARDDRSSPSIDRPTTGPRPFDRATLEQAASSIRLTADHATRACASCYFLRLTAAAAR